MIRAVVWAHRRVPACDGSQTDLQRIWKGDAAGKLRVVQWLEEWRDLGRPAAKAIEDKPRGKQTGGVHIPEVKDDIAW